MTSKNVHLKIGELKTNIGQIKNLELSVGKVINDSWEEQMGPTPMPHFNANMRETNSTTVLAYILRSGHPICSTIFYLKDQLLLEFLARQEL